MKDILPFSLYSSFSLLHHQTKAKEILSDFSPNLIQSDAMQDLFFSFKRPCMTSISEEFYCSLL